MIDRIQNILSQPVLKKDRLTFLGILAIMSLIIFVYKSYFKQGSNDEWMIPFCGITGFILLGLLFSKFGNGLLRTWMSISTILGSTIFMVLLFLVYFLFLSPVFIIVNAFKRKSKTSIKTNWMISDGGYHDYKKMG